MVLYNLGSDTNPLHPQTGPVAAELRCGRGGDDVGDDGVMVVVVVVFEWGGGGGDRLVVGGSWPEKWPESGRANGRRRNFREGREASYPFLHIAYGGEPTINLLRSFLNLGRAGDWLTLSNKCSADVPIALVKPITHLVNWKGNFFYVENRIIPSDYPELLLKSNKFDKKSFGDKVPLHPPKLAYLKLAVGPEVEDTNMLVVVGGDGDVRVKSDGGGDDDDGVRLRWPTVEVVLW
ncbi:hypothetical protein Tco_1125347 [Tanacetum coccineum]|uniref:Uncharacterized protein n=1 Tax=Tanacetum coccineum TaxID=301880 RepID=A0ABQ5J8Q7_9ASTR